MGLDSNTLKELAIKVSQYFLNFLESDFKRQQAPRRRVVLQTDSGFTAGRDTLRQDIQETVSVYEQIHLRQVADVYPRPILWRFKIDRERLGKEHGVCSSRAVHNAIAYALKGRHHRNLI